MNNRFLAIVLAVVIVLGAASFLVWWYTARPVASPTPTPPPSTGGANIQTLTLAEGEVSLNFPTDFSLATSPEQVLVHAYIPPCDQEFDYCFFYNGNKYAGTNFEAAGLRVKKRGDLATELTCLNTPPAGFSSSAKPTATTSQNTYAASVSNVSGAAAGHVAEGFLYRLFVRQSSTCYEFETRIGNSQFANYPPGAIKEFTQSDRQVLRDSLASILSTVKIGASGIPVSFPTTPHNKITP